MINNDTEVKLLYAWRGRGVGDEVAKELAQDSAATSDQVKSFYNRLMSEAIEARRPEDEADVAKTVADIPDEAASRMDHLAVLEGNLKALIAARDDYSVEDWPGMTQEIERASNALLMYRSYVKDKNSD